MKYSFVVKVIVVVALAMLNSCQDSGVGPTITAIYTYTAFGADEFKVDSGTLELTRNGSTLIGQINTRTIYAVIKGRVTPSGSIEFTENPEKTLSPYWHGTEQNGSIRGYVEFNTGGRATPLCKNKFEAARVRF